MSIMAQMKDYPYYKYSETRNAYGELVVETNAYGETITSEVETPSTSGIEETPTIKMAINLSNQNTNDYILYNQAEYIGLTTDEVDDTYIIEYENQKLKVKYVNPIGRFKQVALVKI